MKDLGIWVNRNLEPSIHINKIAKKAHAVLSQIQRSTTLRDSKTFIALYKSFVRPHLKTAASCWNPSKREDILTLERVQKRAFRMVTDLGKISYEEKLKKMGMQSLEDRRKRGDLIDTFKYMNGIYDADPLKLFTFVQTRHERNTRSYLENNLVPEKTSLNVRKNFFTNRIVNEWNLLPSDIRYGSSLNEFKNYYDADIEMIHNV